MIQWWRDIFKTEYIDVPVWYYDKLGCRVDVGVVTVPEHCTEEHCKTEVLSFLDKKLKYTTCMCYWRCE